MKTIEVAVKSLAEELKKFKAAPTEGCLVELVDEADLFNWNVSIFGAPDTLLTGGYFKVGWLVGVCFLFIVFCPQVIVQDFLVLCYRK